MENSWYELREQLADKCKKTDSDAGALKIGNDEFQMLIPNDYGDGTTRYAVLEKDSFDYDLFEFRGVVKGKFNIYEYDCGDDIKETIEGKFHIYVGDGFVVFEKCN